MPAYFVAFFTSDGSNFRVPGNNPKNGLSPTIWLSRTWARILFNIWWFFEVPQRLRRAPLQKSSKMAKLSPTHYSSMVLPKLETLVLGTRIHHYPSPTWYNVPRCGNIFTAGWLLRLIKQQRELLLFQRKRSAHWFLTLMRAIKVSPKSHFERPISQQQQTPKGNTARLSFWSNCNIATAWAIPGIYEEEGRLPPKNSQGCEVRRVWSEKKKMYICASLDNTCLLLMWQDLFY